MSIKNQRTDLRIVLLSDNKDRELAYLRAVKEVLQEIVSPHVSIVGSVANKQETFYRLQKIKPHIVFVSQVIEDTMRDLAVYVKDSGGLVFILPAEITVIPTLSKLLVNQEVDYDQIVDAIFLPGKKMLSLYKGTSIDARKLSLVGTPKIDVLVNQNSDEFLSRKEFLETHFIPSTKKNIFIFPSFVTIPVEYLKQNECFAGEEKHLLKNNKYILDSQKKFIAAIDQLCQDFPDHNIILKTHPLEPSHKYAKINHTNFFLLSNLSFYNCLNSIDLCIHWSSTIATECWIKGIPTLQFVPIPKSDSISELKDGNPVLTSYPLLKNAVIKHLKAPLESKYLKYQNQFLTFNYFKLDGKSGWRIAQDVLARTASKLWNVNYKRVFDKKVYLILALRKMIGVTATYWLCSLLLKKYNWRYAVHNQVIE